MQVDCNVNVLVALALELELAEVALLRRGIVWSLPLDLCEVVRLQVLVTVEVDGDCAEVLRE